MKSCSAQEVSSSSYARKIKTISLFRFLDIAQKQATKLVRSRKEAMLLRMKAIIDRWEEDHRFLTGTDDYPMAAMHATRDVGVEQLGMEVEQIYQLLRKAKFSAGEQLQLVSHLLMFSDQGPREDRH